MHIHEQVWKKTLDTVNEAGWCIMAIDSGRRSPAPPYAYSVGMCNKGIPELLITGLTPQVACFTLNEICKGLVSGKFRGFDDEQVSGLTPVTFKLRELHLKDVEKFLPICVQYSQHTGKPMQFMQVIFPDTKGSYPGDPACDPKFYKVQSLVGLK